MKIAKVIILVGLVSLLAGCGLSTPVKLARVSTYTIASIKSPPTPRRSKTRLTLLIAQPVANAGYQSAKIVYVDVPYKLKTYANNEWIAPPADMLMPILAQQLRTKGYFHAVATSPFSGTANYRLNTQLLVLRQEFFRPISVVRLVMQVSLINNANNRIAASRRFQVLVSAPENNAYSGVLATNKAASILSRRVANFVVNSIVLR